MQIGIPKETKAQEYRVGLTPSGVAALVRRGHEVIIERNAGVAIGFCNEQYREAGAIVATRDAAFAASLIVKVKEPTLEECAMLAEEQIIFTYLHLAAKQEQARLMLARGCTAIAYETVEDKQGRLPLLKPMSEIAGRMSIQVGAMALQSNAGGRGVLLSGVPGVVPGQVVILGGGVAGSNAAAIATGLGADVTILDRSPETLVRLEVEFAGQARLLMASEENVVAAVRSADLVVGAVLIPGASAPKLIGRERLKEMRHGAVLVDIAIDQGGCFASSRPTTHDQPTFVDQGIVHYCVSNMPAGVARTATEALCRATLPYVCRLADHGLARATAADPGFARGINLHSGRVVHPIVARSLGYS
jgi:alanine dehydrogenase